MSLLSQLVFQPSTGRHYIFRPYLLHFAHRFFLFCVNTIFYSPCFSDYFARFTHARLLCLLHSLWDCDNVNFLVFLFLHRNEKKITALLLLIDFLLFFFFFSHINLLYFLCLFIVRLLLSCYLLFTSSQFHFPASLRFVWLMMTVSLSYGSLVWMTNISSVMSTFLSLENLYVFIKIICIVSATIGVAAIPQSAMPLYHFWGWPLCWHLF